MLTQREIKQFQKEILEWYGKNKRDLPWRRTRDPYHILVSEIMLQQTQVSRVISKYEAWFQKFPTLRSLAKAKTADVLRLWSGLGYNRRALYLQRLARIVMADFHGVIPSDVQVLESLPGIGAYTARAVACFAFDKQVAVVDTNVRKVILLKFYARKESPFEASPFEAKKAEIQQVADRLLPKGRPARNATHSVAGGAYDWNHALMDYVAMILAKEKVPIPKQSKFLGSNRYYRGQIIKLLIKNKKMKISQLSVLLDKDLLFIESILNGLVHDGLIKTSRKSVFIR